MTLKIGSFVINCKDFEKTVAFWQEALHYVPRRAPEGDFAILKDPSGTSPNVSVQETDDLKFGKNRMHLDLYAADRRRRWRGWSSLERRSTGFQRKVRITLSSQTPKASSFASYKSKH